VLTDFILVFGWLCLVLAVAGSLYTVIAGVLVRRYFRARWTAPRPVLSAESVTILKPLHGSEPGLRANLQTHLRQDTAAPVTFVFGVQDPSDSAIDVAKAVIADGAPYAANICHSDRQHGHNLKISNIINMVEAATGDVLVLTDSDIAVPPEHLERVLEALRQPGVGVVTCPYYGKAEAGFWSRFAAMGLTYSFLPNVVTGVSLGLANPCMGSTIALRRETLDKIGGFSVFRNALADDYAIGSAVRAIGLKSVVVPVLVSHSCSEQGFRSLVAHELRWAKTIRGVDLAGHAGSVITHPLALAAMAALLLGFSAASLTVLAAAVIARMGLMASVDHVTGRRSGPRWLAPARDLLSFGVFVGSFFIRSVRWSDKRFRVTSNGDLVPI